MTQIRWYSAVVGVCLVFQGYQLGVSISGDLTRAFREAPAFEKDPGPPINFEVTAFRTMKPLAQQVAPGARVLIVTPYPLPAIPWEYYFPRQRVVFLQRIVADDPNLAKAIALLPAPERQAWGAWIDHLERYGRLWTAERQADELRRADYLVEFLPGIELPARGLELIAAHEQSRLYRIDHEELK